MGAKASIIWKLWRIRHRLLKTVFGHLNVARPSKTTDHLSNKVTNNMQFACIQTSKRTSFEQLFHLGYFTFVRTVNSPRLFGGELVGAWRFLGGEIMVSRWRVGWWQTPWWRDDGTPWQGIETIKHMHIHIRYTIYLPFTRKSKRWKSKDVEIKRCENCSSRNLTNKFCTGTHYFSGVLTLSKTRPIVGCMKLWKC